MSNTVPPRRRHSSGGRRRARAEPVRWSHQAGRASSTCARGKGGREFFNPAVITSVLPSRNPIQLFSEIKATSEIGLAAVALRKLGILLHRLWITKPFDRARALAALLAMRILQTIV